MFVLLFPIGGSAAVAQDFVFPDVEEMVRYCADPAGVGRWCGADAVSPDWLRDSAPLPGVGVRLGIDDTALELEDSEFYLYSSLRRFDRQLRELGGQTTISGFDLRLDFDRHGADMLIDLGAFGIGVRLGRGGILDSEDAYLFIGYDSSH